MKVLVTGAAGFIGSNVCGQLLERGDQVLGVDNLNDYYDVRLKEARLARLERHETFSFTRLDVADGSGIADIFAMTRPDRVVHLAAQAGVRYSIENPVAYAESNLLGFTHMLEACRHNDVSHLVYASSSSVYGSNTLYPFSEEHNVDHPVSFYAASKKANELMAHSYSHLYQMPTTGLRYFTVYGPWGRPDMALFKFTKNILAGIPIDVYNNGNHRRDFTFVDDIVEGTIRVLDRPPAAVQGEAPWRVYNIGNNDSVELGVFIATLENHLGKEAKKNYLPLQAGDVPDTAADVSRLERDVGYRPRVKIDEGIARFVEWYKDYYGIGA
ncbi:MAG: NAD-dependent epimerase [Pseudomonadota bacterium]